MALLLQTTFDDDTVDDETTLVKRNELVLVYKLSEDADAQRIILNGSDFTEAVTNHVHISRYLLCMDITDGYESMTR